MSAYMSGFMIVALVFSMITVQYVAGKYGKAADEANCFGFGCGNVLLAGLGMVAAGIVFGYMGQFTYGKDAPVYEPERWLIGVSCAILIPLLVIFLRFTGMYLWAYWIKPGFDSFRQEAGWW